MFTWICPQCGREVSPSYDECPDCKGKTAPAQPVAGPPPGQAPYPPPPPYQPVPGPEYAPPQAPPQPPPQYYQQPPQAPPAGPPYYQPQQAPPPGPAYYAPAPPQQPQPQYYQAPPQQPAPQYYGPRPPEPPKRNALLNLPPWLMTIVFALGIGGIVFGIYTVLQTSKSPAGTVGGSAPAAAVESPAAKPGTKTNPLQKHIEIAGVRFSQDAKKKTLVTFVIINHSEAEISGLAGNVTIWGRTQKSEEDAQGTFSFTTDLAPFQQKEISAPLNTKLKIYELPDWQNITTDIQITAPAG